MLFRSEYVRIAQTRMTIPPLLGGEGWGEGGRSLHSSYDSIPTKTSRNRKFHFKSWQATQHPYRERNNFLIFNTMARTERAHVRSREDISVLAIVLKIKKL